MTTNLPVPQGASAPQTVGAAPAAPYPAWPPGPAGPWPQQGPDWRRLLGAARRYRWLLVLATLGGGAAGLVATRFLPTEYVARATIWIERGTRGGAERGPSGPIRSAQLLESDAWIELLKSYVVLDEVVRQLRLFLDPQSAANTAVFGGFGLAEEYRPGDYRLVVDHSGGSYTLSTLDGAPLERGALHDSIGTSLGFRWAPPAGALQAGSTTDFSVSTLRDAAERLGQSLTPQIDPSGNFLRLSLGGVDPLWTTTIVNAVANRYVMVAADLKRQRLSELTKILEDQLQYAQQNLQSAETSFQAFRQRTITLPSEPAPSSAGGEAGRDPVFGGFFELKVQREQLRRDREAIGRIVARGLGAGAGADGLSVIPSVQGAGTLTQVLRELATKQAELRALRYRYSDEYPTVRRLADDVAALERETIPSLARDVMRDIGAREASLDGRIGSTSRSLQQIPARAIEEARLRRAVSIAEDLHTSLEQRYQEARLAEASSIPDVRVLDAAVTPQRPVRNTAPRVILVGLLGGLAAALMAIILLDRFDPRLRYPEQVSREMGLPILGILPHVRSRAGRRGPTEREAAEAMEGLRGIRLNLTHAYGAAGPLVLTITSPGPGDGKSFLAANLARAFAARGHATLLIDGDLRRGSLHRRLLVKRTPGLADYLGGDATEEAIIQGTPHDLLWFVGCGHRPEDGAELLETPRMARLLARVRTSYAVIICDSPPLGAGADPYILGTLTGSLLLVVRSGVSHRQIAETNLELLGRLPVRLLGAVLNDVPAWGGWHYYPYAPTYADSSADAAVRRIPRSPAELL